MNITNRRSIPLLVIFLLLLSYLFYNSTITFLPSFIHAWTQSERYAISLQFLQNGFDLFHPATYNLQTVDGITRVDFPINEYFVALLMKFFGTTSPVIFRLYMLALSITGLTFLYRFAKRVTASEIKSWLIVLFVFLSPVYVYYQAGFIPCVPAISFIFIAYYFFYEYKLTEKRKYFYWSVLFFLLAALIRVPFFILLFAILIQQLISYAQKKKVNIYEAIGLLTAFIVFIVYYRYNIHLGRMYGNMFLDTFLPARNLEEFKEIMDKIYHIWSLQYFTIWHYVLLFVSIAFAFYGIVIGTKMHSQHKAFWFNLLIIGIGTLLYFLLMMRQFYDHDYYFLDSLFIPFTLLFVLTIHYISIEGIIGKIIISLFLLSVFFMFRDANKNQEERYITEPWDRVEITRKNFMGSDKFLDSICIPKTAKMLVIDSYSTNIPLILMNRKGYTVYQTSRDNAELALFWFKWDYVVIQDVFVGEVITHYPIVSSMLERVYGNGKISLYKKSNKIQPRSLKQFLGISSGRMLYQTNINFDSPITDDHISNYKNSIRNNNSSFGKLDETIEFGLTVIIKARELKNITNLKALINCDFLGKENLDRIQLVASITNNKETVSYQNFTLTDYFKPSPGWQKLEFQFILPDFKTPDDELKIYLWNPSKANLLYDNWSVIVYK